MTSTPVSNDVTGIMLNVASQSVQKERTDNNFSDVLQKQSNNQKAEETAASKNQTPSRTKVEKPTEGKIKEEQPVEAKETDAASESEKTLEGAKEEALENAEELAGQLLVQIAEALGVSTEEVQAVMDELGMEPVDLLKGENLMQFLVAAGGEADSLSLLTNETLYGTFRELNKTLEEGLAELQQETGMSREEIMQLLDAAKNAETITVDGLNDADTIETMTQQTENKTVSKEGPADAELTGAKETVTVQETSKNENSKGTENGFSGNGQNNFAQNLFQQTAANVTNVTSVISEAGYFSAETEMIMNQIMDFMKVNVGQEMTQLEMQLHPEELGTLQVKVASKDGVITAHFTAENEVVKEALESQMIQLKETFKEQGVKVEAIEVSVQTNSFDRNLEQGRDNQPGEGNDSRPQLRVRRLNLNTLEELPEEELTEEDKLTAEMMEENGTTVDYTV